MMCLTKKQGAKVLVTGGNGFIGSRVVRLLAAGGYTVRILFHQETSETMRVEGVEYERAVGDVRDAAAVREAVKGCAGIVHLAGISHWAGLRSKELEPIVLEGLRNVLNAAVEEKCERVVFVSSAVAINANKNEPVMYTEDSPFELEKSGLRLAIVKHEAEKICHEFVREHKLDVVIVCPVETYGPEDYNFVTAGNIREFLAEEPCFAIPGGTAIAHIDDVAAGILGALEKGRSGERYILGGDNVRIEQLAKLSLKLAGMKGRKVTVVGRNMLSMLLLGSSFVKLPKRFDRDAIEYGQYYWFVDCSKAKEELGYSPRPAREVLIPVIEWLRDSGAVKGIVLDAEAGKRKRDVPDDSDAVSKKVAAQHD